MPIREVDFDTVLKDLLDNTKPFPPVHLYRFSDISPVDLKNLKEIWKKVDAERRFTLLTDLEDLAEADTTMLFDDIAIFAIKDPDARVRAVGIRLLNEYDRVNLIPRIIEIMEGDPDETVRAAAASNLGHYLFMGEMEEIPAEFAQQVLDALKKVYNSKDTELVRRRALESLGFATDPEASVMIKESFDSNKRDWIISALFAMGRSATSEWTQIVIQKIDDDDPEILFEAVRAAGELSIQEARDSLVSMVEEGIDDSVLRGAVAWALSQIGGENVLETLNQMLEDAEDDDEAVFIEEALENLDFTNELEKFSLLDIDSAGEVDLSNVVDLSDLEEEDGDLKIDLDDIK